MFEYNAYFIYLSPPSSTDLNFQEFQNLEFGGEISFVFHLGRVFTLIPRYPSFFQHFTLPSQ